MTIADDHQNPRPETKLAKSLDTIAALRAAMERRLTEVRKEQAERRRIPLVVPQLVVPPDPSQAASLPVMAPPLAPSPSPPPPLPEAKVIRPLQIKTGKKAEPQKEEQKPEEAKRPDGPQETKDAKQPSDTDAKDDRCNAAEWSDILCRIAKHSQTLIAQFMDRNKGKMSDLPSFDPAPVTNAFMGLTNRIVNDPERFLGAQMALWQGYSRIWQSAIARMQGKTVEDVVKPATSDKRFQDADWNNWLFDYLKQTYLMTAQWTHALVKRETENLDPRLARKIDFYTRQMVDAISPSNFWLTNPEVLRATLESNGENLIKGLEKLLSDLERGHGSLRISMTDTEAFKVGTDLATTPGKVVYQNDLMQLIQYAPMTSTVQAVPLLVIPPWINKFYILDLRAKNSFIGHLVSQGFTVFCISWVNPDARHAHMHFDDYMESGSLAAMREIRRITTSNDINIVGYCIGGTLLACTLAYLNKASATSQPSFRTDVSLESAEAARVHQSVPTNLHDLPHVKSATYLVTMIDFADPGDLGVFVDEELLKTAETLMAKQGYMDAATMATAFNLLRSNDLIWSFVVNNYMLGKGLFPFDILYWNSDSTNMPAAMQSFYLRGMYMNNKLVEPDALTMKGVPIDVRTIETPSFLLATREDHIAPWRSTYAATQLYKGPVTFTLASSGHIAGVVNPPGSNKYGYWINSECPPTPEEWMNVAVEHKGSWWPEWWRWLSQYSGDEISARDVTEGTEDAPGSYVKVRAV